MTKKICLFTIFIILLSFGMINTIPEVNENSVNLVNTANSPLTANSSGSIWLNTHFSVNANGYMRLTHSINNPTSAEPPEDVEFKQFYQIELYNSSDHLENLYINLYLAEDQYSGEELGKLIVLQFESESAFYYQINATFFLDEMKFLISDIEIDEKAVYAIGILDERDPFAHITIPGFPNEFLSMFIILGVFLILKKKSFMKVKKNE